MAGKLATALGNWWFEQTDPERRQSRRRVGQFFRERGQGTPDSYQGLSSSSVVVDLGGYKGDWAASMRQKYDCQVEVFEPHPDFAAALDARFANDPKVTCHPFAIGQKDGSLQLSDSDDASSAFITEGTHVTGQIRAAQQVFRDLGLKDIAVIKINIEGGEYDILPELIQSGLIRDIHTVTVQFHNYSEGDKQRRDDIRAGLAQTHDCRWNYDFIWEEWERKSGT